MQCPQCRSEIAPHWRNCPHCEEFLGFPNVRAAGAPGEKAELDRRYASARGDARHRNCEAVLAAFENDVKQSKAVICRRWGVLNKISERGNDLFKTYYKQLSAGDRLPQDSQFDRVRQAVDATFFPYYFEEINFAALSLDGRGPESYGECSFTFRDEAISHRTTVFEENTLVFCEKHTIPVGQSPPAGYRAVWSERHQSAAAKLHRKVTDRTVPNDFSRILLTQNGATNTDEFTEAHIYGRLDLTAVEQFLAPKPQTTDDRILARRLKRKLREAGADVRTI